jgi:hypothetical protein
MILNYKAIPVFLLLFLNGFSQVGVGTTVPAAALDITSGTNGILVPRIGLSATNVSAPVVNPQGGALISGTLVWNTNTAGTTPNNVTPGFYYWDAVSLKWISLNGVTGNNWTINGNSGTTAGTNYLGTTDSQDLRFKTGGNDKFNIGNLSGQFSSYSLGTITAPTYTWNADLNTGIYSPSADAIGFTTNGTEKFRIPNANQVHAMSLGTAALPFYSFSADPNTGIYSSIADYLNFSTAGLDRMRVRSDGNVAINNVGYVDVQLSVATTANATIGIVSDTDLYTTANNANDAFVGFGDNSYSYGGGWFANIATANGIGYGSAEMGYGALGSVFGTGTYKAGIMGTAETGRRTAGVFGSQGNGVGNSWGALGYRPSAGATNYGGYFYNLNGAAADNFEGTGRLASGAGEGMEKLPIGIGAYGAYMGGWIRGLKFGLTASGKEFGLFVDGKSFRNDAEIQLNKGKDGKTIPTYTQTSTTPDITSKGKGKLENGTIKISFEQDFNSLFTDDEVIISITPLGECNGLFIESQDKNGFVVKELNGGNHNVSFYWTAIATVKDKNMSADIKTAIDFQQNQLKQVMVDETVNKDISKQKKRGDKPRSN